MKIEKMAVIMFFYLLFSSHSWYPLLITVLFFLAFKYLYKTKTPVIIDLHWLKIEERIVYNLLILTFKAFIDRTTLLYLCELIEQQKSSINTRLANDAFLLKLPPPC